MNQRDGVLIVLPLHLLHHHVRRLAYLHLAMLKECEQHRGVGAGGYLGAGVQVKRRRRNSVSSFYRLPRFRFRQFHLHIAADERRDGSLHLTHALPLLDRINRYK